MKKTVAICMLLIASSQVFASGFMKSLLEVSERVTESKNSAPVKVPLTAGADVEIGFSPEGSAESLVLKVINSSKKEIRLSAYAFTSTTIAKALISAHKRGVDVKVLADASTLEEELRRKKQPGRAALSALKNAGIEVRTIEKYLLHHDKSIVVDRTTVQSGSFNYTYSATKNSEQVIVLWNAKEVATVFLNHWNSRWAEGTAFKTRY